MQQIFKIFTLIFCSILFAGNVFATAAPSATYQIIIDAGSSGSRLHLYQLSKTNNLFGIKIQSIYSTKVKPGLSSYAKHPETVQAAIQPLLNKTRAQLNQRHINAKNIPVNILATGGMRLLSLSARQKIMGNLRAYIQEKTPFKPEKLNVISGTDEALYLWLAANYANQAHQDKPSNTIGALDLGGSSGQIAFESTQKTNLTVRLGKKAYPLYIKSYLGIGSESMEKVVNNANCYPRNYPLPDHRLGLGHFNACKAAITKVLRKHHINNTPKINKQQKFVALSNFYYLQQFFKLQNPLNLNELTNKGAVFCQTDWQSLRKKYQGHSSYSYLKSFCLKSALIVALLKEYGFSSQTSIDQTNELRGIPLTWTLGAALSQ